MSKKKVQTVYFTKDIVDIMAERTGYSKKICHDTLMSFTGVVGDIIGDGDVVNMVGFGKFRPAEIASHKIISIHKHKRITIPKHVRPAFKAGKYLKEYLVDNSPTKKSKKN